MRGGHPFLRAARPEGPEHMLTPRTKAGGQGRSARNPSKRAAVLGVAALLFSALAGKAAALPPPVPVSQFDMTGYLQAATLGGADVLAGGTLTVNGQPVVVPRNLEVIFPAGIFTWEQMFQLAPPPYGPSQTGMAMS